MNLNFEHCYPCVYWPIIKTKWKLLSQKDHVLHLWTPINKSKLKICDTIKQNESSEVGQIQFLFFWLIVYIICIATFYKRPHWNWSISFKDTGSWRVSKTTGNKKKLSAFFGYILKSVFTSSRLILLDHVTFYHRKIMLCTFELWNHETLHRLCKYNMNDSYTTCDSH